MKWNELEQFGGCVNGFEQIEGQVNYIGGVPIISQTEECVTHYVLIKKGAAVRRTPLSDLTHISAFSLKKLIFLLITVKLSLKVSIILILR